LHLIYSHLQKGRQFQGAARAGCFIRESVAGAQSHSEAGGAVPLATTVQSRSPQQGIQGRSRAAYQVLPTVQIGRHLCRDGAGLCHNQHQNQVGTRPGTGITAA